MLTRHETTASLEGASSPVGPPSRCIRQRGDNPAARIALILATLAAAACGGDDGGSPTMPMPEEPPTQPPTQPPTKPTTGDLKGMAVYAVDLANRLLVFGTESTDQVNHMVGVTGLPLLARIVGIDFRPSDGKLYGVGNDSRVYLMDWETGEATAVGSEPFSPAISKFFDIHFGMGFDPVQDKIRLIAAESGGNWLIDPDDGTAVLDKNVHYVAGDPNQGKRPRILGLAYTPPHASQAFRVGFQGPCEDLMYAIDADLAEYIGSCDVNDGGFLSMGPLPDVTAIARCGELKFDHGPGNLWLLIQRGAQQLNSMGSVDPETGLIHWAGDVPDSSPVQAITFGPTPPGSSMRAPTREQLTPSAARVPGLTGGDGGVPCPGT